LYTNVLILVYGFIHNFVIFLTTAIISWQSILLMEETFVSEEKPLVLCETLTNFTT
jgi:hypothetical protein